MSRILKSKRQIAILIAVVVIIACLLLLHYYTVAVFSIVVIISGHYLNQKIYEKIKKPLEKLSPKREVKSIDRLVIGDMCADVDEEVENNLLITAPNRSLYASSLILKHVGSVLTEGGTVVIVAPLKQTRGKITVFDTPFISLISSLEEGCKRSSLKNEYPLIVSPIRSFKLLLDRKRKTVETQCPDTTIINYCRRKGFKLKYLK